MIDSTPAPRPDGIAARAFYRHPRCGGFLSVEIHWGTLQAGTGGPSIALNGERCVKTHCNKCDGSMWMGGLYLEALVEGDYGARVAGERDRFRKAIAAGAEDDSVGES